ncbi:MAG: formyltransferase family protein [Gammaproteobacteria bacterium]|jgi:methionyl-tRNA formyltransferase
MIESTRFVLLGTGGLFTRTVANKLIHRQTIPVAYIQAGEQPAHLAGFSQIDIEVPSSDNSLESLLKQHSLTCYYETGISLAQTITNLDCHFLLVACWPQKLQADVLNAVSGAALNLHPSLLPRFRGRAPIADQLSSEDRHFGVTLHLLDNQLDTGDIVDQQPFPVPDNATHDEIEMRAAEVGSDLFIDAIKHFHYPGWNLKRQQSS